MYDNLYIYITKVNILKNIKINVKIFNDSKI